MMAGPAEIMCLPSNNVVRNNCSREARYHHPRVPGVRSPLGAADAETAALTKPEMPDRRLAEEASQKR